MSELMAWRSEVIRSHTAVISDVLEFDHCSSVHEAARDRLSESSRWHDSAYSRYTELLSLAHAGPASGLQVGSRKPRGKAPAVVIDDDGEDELDVAQELDEDELDVAQELDDDDAEMAV